MTEKDQLKLYRSRLAELFAGYRAEWLNERIFELFTEPSYFPHLTTSHPCFLEGGRGTGKTTALRCLSYQGQAALRQLRQSDAVDWPYFGMYYRVNTNRVRAFSGRELDSAVWTRMFGHYINLEFSDLIVGFLHWYRQQNPAAESPSPSSLREISLALNLQRATTLSELAAEIRTAKVKFEAAVNNVADDAKKPQLSMQGVPVDMLMREVKALAHFRNRPFFFLIDEYENLDAAQQRVLNTLIKHCGEFYSFKIGVRELGFRERSTLNDGEQLTHPADYKLINISQELATRFPSFAAEVCAQRLHQVLGDCSPVPTVNSLLPELSPEREAEQLGVRSTIGSDLKALQASDDIRFSEWLAGASQLEVFALTGRAAAEGKTTSEKLDEILEQPKRWKEHYGNYKYAYLFAIRRGKSGIRKHFAGWRVFCLLAASNIRYLLELVDQALDQHFEAGCGPNDGVDPRIQTRVAQATGRRNLRELEGLSLSGARLTRFLLGWGRVLQIMAENPFGHAPEISQFCLSSQKVDEDTRLAVEELLTEGIMHLALLRYPASKLQEQTDVREFDYVIHPIFAPFFGFSHRRKRKMELSHGDVSDLVLQRRRAIGTIVARQNRNMDDDLPEQMELFREYYESLL